MNHSARSIVLAVFLALTLVLAQVSPAQAQTTLPAEINKQFTPLQIDTGGVSILKITIFNPNTYQLTDVAFTDNLVGVQPGLFIADQGGGTGLVSNSCGGSVTANAGDDEITLANGTVPAQTAVPGQCAIEVAVSSLTEGNLINTIPAHNNPPGAIGLTATGDNGSVVNTSPASATISVIAVDPPSMSKTFNPNTIYIGDTSQMTIRINNNDPDTNLTNVSFTDNLPGGVKIATPPSASMTGCGAGAILSAAADATSLSLSSGTITPTTDCIIRVNVTGPAGEHTNIIPAGPGGPGSLQTKQGVTNNTPVSADLNIQPVEILKAFAPATIDAGDTSVLTITLQNPTNSPYTGASLTDIMPAGLTVQASPVPSTTCGTGIVTVPPARDRVVLTGGTIPARPSPSALGTCTITATVRADLTAVGTLTNQIQPGDFSANGGAVTNFSLVQANLNVTPALTGTKSFASPYAIALDGLNLVTITLTNNSSTPFTDVDFSDDLPSGLTVATTTTTPAAPSNPATTCGSGSLTYDTDTVTLADGTLGANSSCTVTFYVTSNLASATPYDNTIPPNAVTACTSGTPPPVICVGNGSGISTGIGLTVVNANQLPLEVGKSFNPSSSTGSGSRVTITITAPLDIGVNGIQLTDTLPTGMTVSATPGVATTCPGGTARVTAAPLSNQIIFANLGTDPLLAAGASCTISVNVSAGPGRYVNDIPVNAIQTAQLRTNELDDASATLSLTSMTMRKAFYPDTVQADGKSTLTITLQNTSTTALKNLSLTDDLPGSITNGIVIANPANVITTCEVLPGEATITANPGEQTIQLTNGTVPAQVGSVPGICTITLDVQGKDATPATTSTHVNNIPTTNVSATVGSSGPTIYPLNPANDDLTIRNLRIGVVKGFDPVLVYGGATSTMTIRLINPNSTMLTGVAFTDDMDSLLPGIILADPPMFDTGTCGGTLTGNAGDPSFSFSGGILYPNRACELTLRVIMNVNGNRTNRIPAGAVTTFNGVSSDQPTEASLTNLPGLSVVKMFNPNPVAINEVSLLTITISNTSNVPVVNMGLLDNFPTLPDGLVVAGGTDYFADNTCNTGAAAPLTATAGADFIQLSGGNLNGIGNPNSSCTIRVNVVSANPGAFENIIPVGGVTADGGVQNNNPGSDILYVGSLYSLGNRVWLDTNNNGTIDSNEVGVDDVTVELYSDVAGVPTLRDTQLTDQGGYYRFDDLEPGDYTVVIPASQFAAGAPLAGYWSSGTSINVSGALIDSTNPVTDDPDDDVDSDENGITQTSGAFNGAVISSPITLGPDASEPTNDDDAPLANPFGESPDDYSNRTVDFGFYRVSVGNLVFLDSNANGTYGSGDRVIPGATVRLFASDGATEINVGPDGILGTIDDAPGGMLSDIDGTYLFDGLAAGSYVIKVTPPAGVGYTSTVDSADTATPNSNVNNNDNGVGTAGGEVSSAGGVNAVTLTPGSPGALNQNTIDNATGSTYNPTMDFGFLLYSLGNRVWFDTNNNNTIDGSEVGVSGVFVTLYQDDGDGVYDAGDTYVGYDITDSNGYYRFDDLPAGDYVVVLPNDNFTSGGGYSALAGYWSSGTSMTSAGVLSDSTVTDPDNDADSDDNGVTTFSSTSIADPNPINYVSSLAVTLGGLPAEPTGETAPNGQGTLDNHANMTADFGFYRTGIGNLVFVNASPSGIDDGDYDAGVDLPLAGATVTLYAGDGTTQIPTGSDGVLGVGLDNTNFFPTVANGLYAFSGLPAGDYVVKVTPPAGYSSMVDTASPGDTADPDVNADNNDNGIGVLGGEVSSGVLTMSPATETLSATITRTDATGLTTDTSVDFGFISPNYSLGNRVWYDTNNNGFIDAGESGINNVRLRLYLDNGTTPGVYDAGDTEVNVGPDGILGTADDAPNGVVTNGTGYYRFDGLPAGEYVVRLPTPPAGYWSSGTRRADLTGVITDTFGPDPDNDTDIDDNGITTFNNPGTITATVNYVSSAAVTLGPGSNEPVDENDPTAPFWQGTGDNRANMTVDFGFYRTRIGDLVFVDNNNDGLYNAGDAVLPGATVRLFTSDGLIQIGGDATSDASGNYSFQNLPEGNYVVKVTPPAGYASATDTAGSLDPDSNINNDDNGIGTAYGAVVTSSGQLTMNPGTDAAKPVRTITPGNTRDDSVDFGFVPLVAIGNRVWIDDGAGTIANANNGILDTGEVGINNVTVQLYGLGIDGIAGTADDNLVGATTTASIGANAGYYQFDNLFPGQYYVKIPTSEFSTGGDLVGYASSIGNGGLNDDDDQSGVNGDENGIDNADLAANGIVTPVYNLLPGTEPTTDEHAGIYTGALSNDSVNFTADFGFFYPLSIGNRVFLDNGAGIAAFLDNGIMNAGELPIENVRVELWRDTNGTAGLQASGATPDTLLRFDITDAGGYYLFDGLHAGEYYVHIPAVNFTTGALQGTNNSTPTGTENAGVAGNPYTPNTDRDDNGVNNARPDLNGISSGPILLVRDNEPINESELSADTGVVFGNDPTMDDGPNLRGRYGEGDNNSNLTVDFGFVPVYSLGNRVWLDTGGTTGTPNNGIMDGNEAGINGLTVNLYLDANDNGIPDDINVIGNPADDIFATTTTDLNGYYRFDNLIAGTYIVEVVPTAGLGSTVDVNQDPDDNADLDDNGVIVLVSGEVRSKPITLGDLPEPTGEEPTPNPDSANGEAPDAQSNRTVDFGFVGAVAIGNVVWFDTGAGANYNNGIFNTDESGVPGVTVQLFTASGVEVPVGPDGIPGTSDDALGGMVTSGGGYYRFDRLIPGDYYVYLPASNFAGDPDGAGPLTAGPLYTYLSSSGSGTSETTDNNADENGIDGTPANPLTVNGIRTIVYNLAPGTMPTGEGQSNYTGTLPDNSVNFTADFGFVETYSLGNRVWFDANGNGTRDASEGIGSLPAGIPVNLYRESDPVNIFLTTTTDTDGYYRFDNLVAGNYIVEVIPPAGYASTVDAGDPDSDPDDDDDNGINFVGSNVRSNPVTLGPGGIEPETENNPATNPDTADGEAPNDRSNRTVDFGFILANATSNKQLTSTVMMDNGPTPGTDTTTTPEVTIGEILTYVTRLQIPSGETFTNLRAVDQLGTGLAFVGCDSINVSDPGLTTNLTGGFDAACNNPGTTPPASPLVTPRTGSYNDANQITFTLGEVFNNTADTQIVSITYRVIVLDIPSNRDGVGGLNNSATWSWDGTTLPPSQADPVQVVEPELSIDKRSTPRSAPYGTNIGFTISIAHTAASSMDAFDVVVNDILPVGLQYIAGSVQFAGLAPNVPVAPADYYDPATNTLTFNWDVFPLGSTSTITFAATFVGPAPVVNSANVAWTSLPIDPQPSGLPVQLSPFNDFSTERWYDPADLTGLNPYGRSDSVTITLPAEEDRGNKNPWILPATGFAPNVITELPPMPAGFAYAQTDILLEIPKLKQTLKLAGVPYDNEKREWKLTWLNTEAGWLENTAFPTHAGNSALTAHTTLSNGQPGPFAKLGTLSYGDQVIIHLDGQKYIFEVRENKQVKPSAVSSTLKHEEYPWLTLITCKSYNEKTGEYTYRTVVRAILVKVMDE